MDTKDRLIQEQAAEIQRLKEVIARLEEEIARLKKDSHNSSKPPSSDIVKPKRPPAKRSRKKRKRGGQFGHRKCNRVSFRPDEVDEVIEYELTARDARDLDPLDAWRVVQQVSLPEKLYTVTEHRARKYRDPKTGGIVIAPLPADVQQGGLLGPNLTATVAFLKGGCHMSYSTIQRFLGEVVRLDVSRGMLCKAVHKVSRALERPYRELVERLPNESRLGVDETGHHDDGTLHWTWCFRTPRYSVFHIDPSRGSGVLETILGDAFDGVISADYWGAYRKHARLFGTRMQYCLAHLIREIRFLAERKVRGVSRWAKNLLQDLQALFHTLHRREQLTASGFLRTIERHKEAFLRRVRRPPDHSAARKLARRFKGDAAAEYFRFITEPRVEPTNNATEREIRPVVIDRKITQGTRGQTGMRWCERIWSILATCKKQTRNSLEYLHLCLLAHWNQTLYPQLL